MPTDLLKSPITAIAAGTVAILALLAMSVLGGHIDMADAAGLLFRALHVLAAMVWVGLIVFVNVIQLAVLSEAPDADRKAILTHIVPRTARMFGHAANVTVVTGLVLLVALGYFSRPPPDALWMWIGTVGGFAMLGFVHARISPALRVVLDPQMSDAASKAEARETVRFYARLNLLLSVPVTFAMLAAAHG